MDDFPLERLNNLVGLGADFYQMAIQMVYSLLESQERFLKCNVQVHIQVVSNTLELIVGNLLYCENHITRNHIWDLLCFSFKDDVVSISHALLNVDIQLLLVRHDLLALAMWTVLGIDMTSASTPVALNLHLHSHTNSHLNFLQSHT